MAQDNLQALMKFKDLSYAHLTATLHHKIQWRGREVILTGIAPEFEPSGKKKAPMLFQVKPGTVFAGYQLGSEFGLREGDIIRLYNREFTIHRVLAETGSVDDIRIYLDLAELQKLLNMEGQINEIRAINCLCLSEGEDPLSELRNQLEETLPDSKVIMNKTIANARQEQRHTIDKYFGVILPFVLLTSFLWVAAMAYVNVNDRKTEIGIYRALGFSSWKIGWIFMGKAIFLAVVAAAIAFWLGTWLTFGVGPQIFKVTANVISTDYQLLKWAVILTPLGAILATMVPALLAVFQDPAETLRHA
jgi:putative ABC transport system permease protein